MHDLISSPQTQTISQGYLPREAQSFRTILARDVLKSYLDLMIDISSGDLVCSIESVEGKHLISIPSIFLICLIAIQLPKFMKLKSHS